MGRYVEIKKIKAEEKVYYYSVQSPDYTDIPLFYIKINALAQTVAFYKSISDHESEFIVHMGRDLDRSPDWLPSFLVYATLKKAWEAVKNNKFDSFISFQS